MNTKSLYDAITRMIEKLPTWNEDAVIYRCLWLGITDGYECDPRSTYENVSREQETTVIFECHDLDEIFQDFGAEENDAAWLLAQIIQEQLGTSISSAAATLGKITSEEKAIASRENGKLGGRPPTYMTIYATPQFGGSYTLTDNKGNEVDNGTVYPTHESALEAAKLLFPSGRGVRNGLRIKISEFSKGKEE